MKLTCSLCKSQDVAYLRAMPYGMVCPGCESIVGPRFCGVNEAKQIIAKGKKVQP